MPSSAWTLRASFSDVDGEALIYSATPADGGALPTWLTFDNGSFSGTPSSDDLGSLDITVSAKDAGGETASDTFTLTVNNVNDAPTFSSSPVTLRLCGSALQLPDRHSRP